MLSEAFHYKRWADERTLDAIERIDGLRFPHATSFARQQLNHLVLVEELFKARLLGAMAPHQSTNTERVPELVELKQRIRESNAWFSHYVEQLQDYRRSEMVAFQFVDGQHGSMTRLEILFHVINHATYHRGSIAHCLDLAGVPHPADTYTVFIHSQEPDRRKQPSRGV